MFAVEDRRCTAALADLVIAAKGKLHLVAGDALKTDLVTLARAPRAIVANLPYNIGTELLIGWLHHIREYRSLTLMFQTEVADHDRGARRQILWPPVGHRPILLQGGTDARHSGCGLHPTAQSLIHRRTSDAARHRPADVVLTILEKVTAAAFGQRRKMLRSSLKSLGGEALLRRAGIDPERRGETLSLSEFETLARLL